MTDPTIHSDEGMQVQLTEYASTLADIPDFLDQVKERLDVLKAEGDRSRASVKDYEEQLVGMDDELGLTLTEVRAAVAHDLAILIDWALDAGADPATLQGLTYEISAETVKARAMVRSAF
jgi:hypothetical protein